MPITILQFTHPGGQYTLNRIEKKTNVKEWNIGNHHRKFMIAKGQYINNSVLSSPQNLLFWGEWEPTSEILKCFNPSDSLLYPNYLHSPFIELDKKGRVIKRNSALKVKLPRNCISKIVPGCVNCYNQFQNTDPFVFGNYFYYSCCKQNHFTSLRKLDIGSIILFGSTIPATHGGPCFALDTVFVVGDKRTYTARTSQKDLAGFIPKYYDEIMGFNTWGGNTQFTCYKGATFNNPINGMYSFVPCKLEENNPNGFSRAVLTANDFNSISIPGLAKYKKNNLIITDNLNSAPKVIDSDLVNNKTVWNKVCQIIASQGYLQGMNFEYKII